MLKQDADTLQEIADRFDRLGAMANAVRESEGNAENEGGKDKYAIRELETGQKYVEESRNVLSGNDPEIWRKQIIRYINTTIRNGKNITVYADDGTPFTITNNTAGKAAFRNEINEGNGKRRLMNDDEYAVKLRAESHIDELAKVSAGNNKLVPDTKKHSFAKDGFFYRKAYWKDATGYYQITFSVGKNGEINTVYNVGRIKKAQFPVGKALGAHRLNGNRTDNIISESEKINNPSGEKFSLRDDAYMAAAMLQQDADTLQEIADRFDRLGAMANAVRESEGNAENRGGNDRLSIRDRNGNEMPVGEDAYEENKRIVANMEPIITLSGNPFEKNEREDFVTMGTKYFDSIGNVAHSHVFGDVRLNEAGIRHMLAQGITRRKTALLPAVKEVIEKGHVIMTDENHKGKMFDTAIVAGVVEWNGKQFYMGVVMRQDKGYINSYYFHDAVIVEKRRPNISHQDAGVGGKAGSIREGEVEPSVSSILANLADYNTEFQEKFSLRDVDTQNDEMTRLMQENSELRETV
ncbi:MAG: hypothetical protein ACI4ML_08535, partial [Aristaeellaceae bacterium]